jgi:hypothetical protein
MSKENKQNKEFIKEKAFVDNLFYVEELSNYTEDEEEIQKRIAQLKLDIEEYNQEELYFKKDAIINNTFLMRILAHALPDGTDYYLTTTMLNRITQNYNDYVRVFENNEDEAFKMLEIYDGNLIPMTSEGFYKLDDVIVNKVIDDSDFYITSSEDKDHIKNEIFNTWENQKELLTQESLNNYSEKRNGINFKHFIFCEEYLKRGKIKPTCEHLGISRNTAYLWLKDDKVKEYLKSRQDEIKQETDNKFLDTYNSCFNELNDMIKSNYMQNSDKIRAIDVFLKHYENIERLKQPTYED